MVSNNDWIEKAAKDQRKKNLKDLQKSWGTTAEGHFIEKQKIRLFGSNIQRNCNGLQIFAQFCTT